ncbi:class I SAM-dependent methyltransferase [Pelobacter seleniigenes]|uniref:class I SAM-dependent methyltransferase n=1 Tax=Pelobacter seleniigenes TaxID=407188 RepID=UPI0004A6D298|nr:class I SAM-dependent methyltransferase [Pelobacter seleniigenes]
MATVKQHYEEVLADVYVWMFGGFSNALAQNSAFLSRHDIKPVSSGIAIDLGAGCGFQSIPLARTGFTVTAIDHSQKLLNLLADHADDLSITIINDDLVQFDRHLTTSAELIVCMTDTLLHLDSKATVCELFRKIFTALEKNGRFIATFRDLSFELSALERFIPVKSDNSSIMTCFLEYEPETVKVHDLVYKKENEQWTCHKSFYRKLRLSPDWVLEQLSGAGFKSIEMSNDQGLISVIATKR